MANDSNYVKLLSLLNTILVYNGNYNGKKAQDEVSGLHAFKTEAGIVGREQYPLFKNHRAV